MVDHGTVISWDDSAVSGRPTAAVSGARFGLIHRPYRCCPKLSPKSRGQAHHQTHSDVSQTHGTKAMLQVQNINIHIIWNYGSPKKIHLNFLKRETSGILLSLKTSGHWELLLLSLGKLRPAAAPAQQGAHRLRSVAISGLAQGVKWNEALEIFQKSLGWKTCNTILYYFFFFWWLTVHITLIFPNFGMNTVWKLWLSHFSNGCWNHQSYILKTWWRSSRSITFEQFRLVETFGGNDQLRKNGEHRPLDVIFGSGN